MLKINLTESELDNIRIVCDYLFVDQYKDMATFPRFEECFGIFTTNLKLSLSNVYNEICGENKKYITFRRMIAAYLKYKNYPKETSTDFKNFFSLIFKQTLKKESQFAGREIGKAKKYNTTNSKKHRGISRIVVLTDEDNVIKGLKMEYDDFFKNDLYETRGQGDLYMKLDLALTVLDDNDKSKGRFNKRNLNRDTITHVFGTFKEKIDFLGFKCRSGKMQFVGKPSGDPFLFGASGKHFHYIKIQVNGCITKIEPFFIQSKRDNPMIRTKTIEEIDDDFLEDKPMYEETKEGRYPSKEAMNKASLHPFINDDHFVSQGKRNQKVGSGYGEICSYEKRYWRNKVDEIDDTYVISHNALMKEAEDVKMKKEERKRKRKEENKRMNTEQNHNGFDTERTHGRRRKRKQQKKQQQQLQQQYQYLPQQHQQIQYQQYQQYRYQQYDDDEGYEIRQKATFSVHGHFNKQGIIVWDGVSVNGLSSNDFLYDEDNYNKLLDKFGNSLDSELNHEKQKDLYEKNYNFYDDYIKRLHPEEKSKEMSPRRIEDIDSLQSKMEAIRNEINKKKMNKVDVFFDDYTRQEEEDDEEEEGIPFDPAADKRCLKNWNNMCKKIARHSGIFVIRTIGAIIRALHMLQNVEANFVDNTMPLKEKVKIYELLTSNKKIIQFLTKAKQEAEKKKGHKKALSDAELIIEKDDMDEDDDDYDEIDQKKINVNELPKINKKLDYIQATIRKDPKNKEVLIGYYEKLQKEKNAIIDKLNKEEKEYLAKDSQYDAAKALKEEEAERKRIIEEENKRLLEQQRLELERENERTEIVSFTNLEMPKDTKIYKKQNLCKAGATYTDDMFPPEKKSLCPVNAKGGWALPTDIEKEDVQDWETFKWARVEEIFESKDFQVFHDGVDHDDIIQGGLGDCYFLSAIAAVCKFPSLITKLFYFKEKSQEHCYGVYLRINGIWSLVLVDDFIPCYDSYGLNFAFSSTNGNELWVILLEKAWAKINGSYAKIIGGQPHEVFDVVTNAYSEKIDIVQKLSEKIWQSMIEAEEKGYIMTAGTSGDTYNLNLEDLGLVPGHAYTILSVHEVKCGVTKERLVYIRNPWGNGEWSGDWSDSSDKWTNALKKQLNMEEEKDDGEFYMSYTDFIKYFVVLGICKLHEDYQYSLLRTEKIDAETGPFITKVKVKDNKVHTFLQLHQKNPRIILRDGTFCEPVSNYLLLCDEKFNYISAATNSEMNLCIEATLNQGTYYLISDINYRYTNPKVHSYNLTSYSSKPVGLKKAEDLLVADVLNKALIDYAKKNITPTSKFGGQLYKSKKYSPEFPFTFSVFDNVSKKEVALTSTASFRGKKCCTFYPGKDKDESKTLSQTIPAGQAGVFIQMRFSPSAMCDYEIESETVAAQEDIEDIVFKAIPDELDDKGEILQYLHEYDNGYYVGIENKSRLNMNLSLALEGLIYKQEPTKTEVLFTLNKQTKKVFELTVKPKYKGEISFQFDYA